MLLMIERPQVGVRSSHHTLHTRTNAGDWRS